MNPAHGGFSEAGLWQLVESGEYTVDLDAWSELAAAADGPVLDLGCGVGRVSHHLNRLGHPTVGLDRDPGLIADFNRTKSEGSPAAVPADVSERTDLAGLLAPGGPLGPESPWQAKRFGLVIAPQQLVQIIGGEEARMNLLHALAEILEPGGTAAFAICEELPEVSIHYPAVPPDMNEIGGWVHCSQPVAIEPTADTVTAVRLRQSLAPDGTSTRSEDVIVIHRLSRDGFERELLAAGLQPTGGGSIAQTDRHMGSTMVLARPSLS